MDQNKIYDVIIIGGSYAGLSAALSLGRFLRKVLIIDSNLPCNRQTPHSHNFLTQDGEKPADIGEKAKHQLYKYKTVEFIDAIATKAEKIENNILIHINNGESFSAKKVIFATGITDLMPDIKGFSDCWGISAIHCPYCHGYEAKNQSTGVIANGDAAIHYVQLIKNLTSDIKIFSNGKSTFTSEQLAQLQKHNIEIIETKIVEINHKNGLLKHLILADDSIYPLGVLYHRPQFKQHCKILEDLGCEITEQGYIKVDASQKTNIANIYACGDLANPMRSVANAVATGSIAGAGVNGALSAESF